MAERGRRQPFRGRRGGSDDREAQRRAEGERERVRREQADFDPAPPTDEDWTVPQGSGLRRVRAPEGVADLVEQFLGQRGLADRVRTTRLLQDWPTIVGPEIAEHAVPRGIERGVLHLVVESPAWATQLQWFEQIIIDKVNEAAGANVVRAVRLVVGQQGR